MGIKTKTVIEYTCDKCHKVVDDYFHGSHSIDLGGEPDREEYVEIKLEYVRAWEGNQIVCKPCAANFLRAAAARIENDTRRS